MRLSYTLFLSLLGALALGTLNVRAAGPVTTREQGATLTLANDYLERTLEVTEGTVRTVRLLNKLSGHTHEVRGDEFELKLTYERVGYHFGGENPLMLSTRDMQVKAHEVQDTPDGGKRAVYHLVLPNSPQEKTGLEATLKYELKPDDYYTRQWLELKTTGTGTFFIDSLAPGKNEWPADNFRLGGFGQPLFSDDLFMGVEYPTSINVADHSEVSLGGIVGLNIPPEGYTSQPAVVGVAASGRVHQAFMDYVQRIRAVPVRQFITYNSWYDLQHTAMTNDLLLERVKQFKDLLLKKYGLPMQSFLLDDAWDDDQNNIWVPDPQRFPTSFRDLTAALQKIDSHLGLWVGPIGGYSLRHFRVDAGRKMGMEITTNGEFLCLAGRNYSRYFRESLVGLVRNFGVNQFKLDGLPFGCNDPTHGHPVGIYSREADLRSLLGTLEALRAENHEIFLDVTTSTWLSPWWLRWADTIWEGGEDYGYLETVPTLTERQSSMNYRDLVLYDDFVRHQVQFPMSSLWTQSVIKGTYLELGGKDESLEDWKDHLVNFLGVGSQLNELYLTPSILKPAEWDALGHSLQWAVTNTHPLLDNGTWVLGDPAKREPYGYLHYSPEKTILMLRNPFVRPAVAIVKLDEAAGFERSDQTLRAEIMYPYREILPGAVRYGDTLHVNLDGYDHQIIELRPLAPGEAHLAGVRYSVGPEAPGGVDFKVYAPEGASITGELSRPLAFGAATLDGEKVELPPTGKPGTLALHFGKANSRENQPTFSAPIIHAISDGTVKVAFTVQLPADFRETRASLLLESPVPGSEVKAEARDNSKSVALAVRKSPQGQWHWFSVDIAPGSHALEFDLHLPPAARNGTQLSGWLRTKRALVAKDLRLTFKSGEKLAAPPANPLPASTQVEKLTYVLLEERGL
jgi:hypothetical protein